jgi:hypothetical protein
MNNINPTLLRKARNLTKAIIKHTSDGFERLTEEEYLARLVVCKGNDKQSACDAFNKETEVCKDWRCGCSLNKKAYWRSEDCPRGFWPIVAQFENK